MARGTQARRHAQAVYEIARERGELERWQADLKAIATALAAPELVAFLGNPKVPLEAKIQLVGQSLPGANPLALNLVYLLIARRRLGLVEQLTLEYDRLLDAHRGLEHAEVTSAVTLNEGQKERLARRLASLTGKKIVLSVSVDPAVVGGLVVRVGDKLIDGSTRARLADLKKSLTERTR